MPPLKWRMARVIKVFPGLDGRARVVELRTSGGITRRAIHNVCPLPVRDGDAKADSVRDDNEAEIVGEQQQQPNSTLREKEANYNLRPAKRRKMGLYTYMCIIMLLLVPAFAKSSCNITKFDNNPGVYFEDVGKTSMIISDWNLVLYYDLRTYWSEYHEFGHAVNKMNGLCQKAKSGEICRAIVHQLQSQLSGINEMNDAMFNQSGKSRGKRALLGFVGNIANALFGVLDDRYADEMAQTIESLHQDDRLLKELLRNQTTVVDATIGLIKKNDLEIRDQFRGMATMIGSLQRQSEALEMEGKFLTIAVHTSLMMAAFQKMQDTMWDSVVEMHHGKIGASILPPERFKQQIEILKPYLPVRLPCDDSTLGIQKMYGLMNIRGRIAEDLIIIRVQIPLVEARRFHTYRTYSIPRMIQSRFMEIVISDEYFLVSHDTAQYYSLGLGEFQQCKKLDDVQRLCRQRRPIRDAHPDSNLCTYELFASHGENLSKQCTAVTSDESTRWIQLSNPNTWLYSFRGTTRVSFVCDEKLEHEFLDGSGIIEVSGHCIIKQGRNMIFGHDTLAGKIQSFILPNVTDGLYESVPQAANITTMVNTYTGHIKELYGIFNTISGQSRLTAHQVFGVHMHTIYTIIGLATPHCY